MIKTLICLASCSVIFNYSLRAQAGAPRNGNLEKPASMRSSRSFVTVPDGTPVQLALGKDLNSKTSRDGDALEFHVLKDVTTGNMVVIPSGALATGHIIEDKHKKMLGRGGKLEFTVDYIKLESGSQVRVRASEKQAGGNKTGTVVALTVLVTPFFLMMHGKDAMIPRDTPVTAYVDGDLHMATAGLESAPPGETGIEPVTNTSAPEPAHTDQFSVITLTSEPPGAEIYVDGEFVGDTPSSIKLAPGHHSIMATKGNFKTWQRTMMVIPGGNLSISIEFEKAQ